MSADLTPPPQGLSHGKIKAMVFKNQIISERV